MGSLTLTADMKSTTGGDDAIVIGLGISGAIRRRGEATESDVMLGVIGIRR